MNPERCLARSLLPLLTSQPATSGGINHKHNHEEKDVHARRPLFCQLERRFFGWLVGCLFVSFTRPACWRCESVPISDSFFLFSFFLFLCAA